MARLTRICPTNIPQHIIQRGNNRQVCFAEKQDFEVYISWLKDYAKKYQVEVHAWILMTNHVHLLCTPKQEKSISRMMQSLGRCYARGLFNNDITKEQLENRFVEQLTRGLCWVMTGFVQRYHY